jgi:hypothetical protein
MTTLSDEEIKTIVKKAAVANNVPAQAVSIGPITDSTGQEAIEVVISIPPGVTDQIVGGPASNTVIEIMLKLQDAGEERIPIIQIEELSGAS